MKVEILNSERKHMKTDNFSMIKKKLRNDTVVQDSLPTCDMNKTGSLQNRKETNFAGRELCTEFSH